FAGRRIMATDGEPEKARWKGTINERARPLQVMHTAEEAFPMGNGQRSSRFQELRQRQREGVLTEAEQAELKLLVQELEAAEATYLTPATERLRQQRGNTRNPEPRLGSSGSPQRDSGAAAARFPCR